MLSRKEIMRIIPHREPFLFIDGINEIDFGVSATGFTRKLSAYKLFSQIKADGQQSYSILSEQIDLNPGSSASTFLRINDYLYLFEGHFGSRLIFPGVLSLAALIETSALALENPSRNQYYFPLSKIQKLRFRRLVFPGDELSIEAKVVSIETSLIKTTVKALKGPEIAAEAELIFDRSANVTDLNVNLHHCILLEAIGEVSSVSLLGKPNNKDKLVYFVGAQDWQIKNPVPLDNKILMKAKLKTMKGALGIGKMTATSRNQMIAEGCLLFFVGN